jgi:hypothetical protein
MVAVGLEGTGGKSVERKEVLLNRDLSGFSVF